MSLAEIFCGGYVESQRDVAVDEEEWIGVRGLRLGP